MIAIVGKLCLPSPVFGATEGVMGSTDSTTHDPSVRVRRGHLPRRRGRERGA